VDEQMRQLRLLVDKLIELPELEEKQMYYSYMVDKVGHFGDDSSEEETKTSSDN
jgi:translation elongation factor P/translation initiation factor 5A